MRQKLLRSPQRGGPAPPTSRRTAEGHCLSPRSGHSILSLRMRDGWPHYIKRVQGPLLRMSVKSDVKADGLGDAAVRARGLRACLVAPRSPRRSRAGTRTSMFSPSAPCSHLPPGRGRKIWEAAAASPRGRCADLRPRPRRSRRPARARPPIPGAQRRGRAGVDGGGGGGREGRPGAVPERQSVRARRSALGKPGRSRRRCHDPEVCSTGIER